MNVILLIIMYVRLVIICVLSLGVWNWFYYVIYIIMVIVDIGSIY